MFLVALTLIVITYPSCVHDNSNANDYYSTNSSTDCYNRINSKESIYVKVDLIGNR